MDVEMFILCVIIILSAVFDDKIPQQSRSQPEEKSRNRQKIVTSSNGNISQSILILSVFICFRINFVNALLPTSFTSTHHKSLTVAGSVIMMWIEVW